MRLVPVSRLQSAFASRARAAGSLALSAAAAAALLAGSPASSAAQPSVVGQWSSPLAWPLVASHAALLPDGRVLVWNDLGDTPRIWDPSSGTFVTAPASELLPGAAQLQLADGRLAVLGGHTATDSGSTRVLRYSVAAGWQTLPPLLQPRDRPTAILLGDGRILALSGETLPGVAADVPEYAEPGSGWIPLAGAQRTLLPRPWAFLLSGGDVLVAGPDRTTRRLTLAGNGGWSVVADMLLGPREAGSAVLVPGATDRILIVGGRDPATPNCEILDLPTSLVWEGTEALASGRRHHNATILADGTVLVTGGTLIGDELQYAVYGAELFDPGAETWSALASMSVPRRRGSVALLLPDARVLVAGGGDGSPGSELHADAEIFSPPYLFQGSRPTLSTAPDSIAYGDSLFVGSSQAQSIAAVWLVRAGSVSGSFNADQRGVELGFTKTTSQIRTRAPDSTNAAPPGMYMLFLVDGAGAPSVAEMLKLYERPPAVPLPDITSTPAATGSVGVQYVYDAEASGPGPITWSLTQAPAWMTLNTINGILTGIPTAETTFLVTLRATNAAGYDEQTWSIVVGGTPRTVIGVPAVWRYFKGTSNPGSDWATVGFNDSAWLVGASGFGFGDGDDTTVLADMRNVYSTLYTRYTFDLFEVQSVTRIALLYDYDDGFAVHLNGTRIFAQLAPTTITNTSLATGSHEALFTVLTRQELTTPSVLGLLQEGQNVLAVVGLNASLGNIDFTLKMGLEVTGGANTPTDTQPDDGTDWFLEPVSPNPFTASARFRFALAGPGSARLELFDVRGRRIRTLLGPQLPQGAHVLEWDGRDEQGQGVYPGVYFYRLRTPGLERRGKLVRSGSPPAR